MATPPMPQSTSACGAAPITCAMMPQAAVLSAVAIQKGRLASFRVPVLLLALSDSWRGEADAALRQSISGRRRADPETSS